MDYYLALAYFIKIGPISLEKGIASCGSIGAFYNASVGVLASILGKKCAAEFSTFRKSFQYEKVLAELERRGISFLTPLNGRIPAQLRTIPDPPLCLFVKGDPGRLTDELLLGIVGTRKVSSYGRQVTEFFSGQLAQSGASIVSGMALGVDSLAHQGALGVRAGKTIAVLGCGVDIIYPTVNRLLYQKIIDSGGAIVSELPPGCMPKPFTFVLRNRLIAGLSRGVLIVEGTLSSGSMITATYAVEQGKDVFAVPMPLLSPLSAGPNSLLKQGAKLVLGPEDILAEYGIESTGEISAEMIDLSSQEALIYESVCIEALSAQALSEKHGIAPGELLGILSKMEIRGLIQRNRGGKYERSVISGQPVPSGGHIYPREPSR